MNRLAFVQTTIGALGAPAVPFYDRVERIVPIRADPDSLIRITVCTRPFRATGPRLDVEQLGEKTVFHNYGHGGSGRDGIAVQPTPQGDDTGWNDDNEVPDRKAAEAGVLQLARFYESAAP